VSKIQTARDWTSNKGAAKPLPLIARGENSLVLFQSIAGWGGSGGSVIQESSFLTQAACFLVFRLQDE
jgi:hypothetical protein